MRPRSTRRGLLVTMLMPFLLAAGPRATMALELAAPVWEAAGISVRPTLSDRARTEVVQWFDPDSAGVDPDYTFFANVIRFGIVAERDDLSVTMEGQEVQLFDLPDDAAGLGPGAVYFANTRSSTQREVHLRRASLAWKAAMLPGFAVEGGRIIFNEGLETTPADPSLAWVKKNRVSQRLIGAFDYTHVGRSFDGGVMRYTSGPWNATFAGGLPTAGGFNISANKHIGELYMLYGALTATDPEWFPRSDARLFYFYYSDDRDVVVTDNRPLAVREADGDALSIHTIGANVAKILPAGPGEVDLLLWVAGQAGEWQSQDHAAWALALEAGYRLVGVRGKPWLRAGWFRGSGDDDPNDGDHHTFFEGLPTARLYALTPFYNLMNNNDLFAQLIVTPWEGAFARFDYHYLRVAEDADLVYSGGGASMSKPLFGYAGFPAAGFNAIGSLIDVSLEQQITANVKVAIYYGHAFGSSIVDAQFPGDSDLDYGYLELTLSL